MLQHSNNHKSNFRVHIIKGFSFKHIRVRYMWKVTQGIQGINTRFPTTIIIPKTKTWEIFYRSFPAVVVLIDPQAGLMTKHKSINHMAIVDDSVFTSPGSDFPLSLLTSDSNAFKKDKNVVQQEQLSCATKGEKNVKGELKSQLATYRDKERVTFQIKHHLKKVNYKLTPEQEKNWYEGLDGKTSKRTQYYNSTQINQKERYKRGIMPNKKKNGELENKEKFDNKVFHNKQAVKNKSYNKPSIEKNSEPTETNIEKKKEDIEKNDET